MAYALRVRRLSPGHGKTRSERDEERARVGRGRRRRERGKERARLASCTRGTTFLRLASRAQRLIKAASARSSSFIPSEHILKLEQYREDQRCPCARMTRKFVKRSKFFEFFVLVVQTGSNRFKSRLPHAC